MWDVLITSQLRSENKCVCMTEQYPRWNVHKITRSYITSLNFGMSLGASMHPLKKWKDLGIALTLLDSIKSIKEQRASSGGNWMIEATVHFYLS